MRIALWALSPELVAAWTQVFGKYRGVSFGSGDILVAGVDAVVSPANSFGHMDGGIDRAYRAFFGLRVQNTLQRVITDRFGGELPVGEAVLIPTRHPRITRLVAAPTMRTPGNIAGTQNAYLATRAALRCALGATPPIERLGIPGMGTGVGRMDPYESAEQMCRAFVEVMEPEEIDD